MHKKKGKKGIIIECKSHSGHRPEIKNALPVLMDNEATFLKSGFLLKWVIMKHFNCFGIRILKLCNCIVKRKVLSTFM